jgi:hypothetical protein
MAMPEGRRFQPGVSGNPGGRPKGLMAYAREKTLDGRELVDFAYSVFKGEKIKVTLRTMAGAVEAEVIPSPEQRFEMLHFLADRAFGKPAQKIDGELRVPLTIVHRSVARDPLAPAPEESERVIEAEPVPKRRKALKA